MLQRLASLGLCLLASAACAPDGERAAPEGRAKHLLLLTIDTLRADHLGIYGGREGISPTIDRLASEGTLFESVYAPSGMTLPSMSSMFSSKPPAETGVLRNRQTVSGDEQLLAERLKAAGFRCRGLTASWILRPEGAGIDQGFDTYELIKDEAKLTEAAVTALRDGFGQGGTREFLWLHYLDPHQPYEAREPYASRFDPDYSGQLTGSEDTLNEIYAQKTRISDRDLAHILAIYDSQIRLLDDRLAEVLAALEQSGVADDTLVVFAADHGEELYDHDSYFFHMNSIYGSVTHVPLLFRQPGRVPAGRRVDGMTEIIDIMPTILAHLGVETSEGDIDTRPRGTDLWPSMQGRPLNKDFAFAQLNSDVFSVRNRDWMLLVSERRKKTAKGKQQGPPAERTRALYDQRADPGEKKDVAAAHPEIVKRMEQVLSAWKEGLRQRSSPFFELDAEATRELQALGYLGGGGGR